MNLACIARSPPNSSYGQRCKQIHVDIGIETSIGRACGHKGFCNQITVAEIRECNVECRRLILSPEDAIDKRPEPASTLRQTTLDIRIQR